MNVEILDPLVRAGYTLIPLHPWNHVDEKGRERGKTPRDSTWVIRDYDPQQVLDWARDGGNIGVRLRDTDLIIDWDPRNLGGADGNEVLARFQETFGLRLDECPRVNTGSGGFHFYLRMPAGLRIRGNLKETFTEALEFKSYGRQVVAPGSIHPNGRPYTWGKLSMIPEAPESLVAAIRKPDRPKGGERSEERISKEHVVHCLDQLSVEKYRDHDEWFELMQAVHYASGGSDEVRAAFIRWSTGDPEYADDAEVIQGRWDSLDPDPKGDVVGVGTLFMHVANAGGSPHVPASMVFEPVKVGVSAEEYQPFFSRYKDGRPKSTYGNTVEGFKGLGIRLAHDTFFDTYIVKDLGRMPEYFTRLKSTEWSDDLCAAARYVLQQQYHLEIGNDTIDSVARANALMDKHDSLVDHLDGLERGDQPLLADWLPRFSQAPPSLYTRAVGRIFLLGAVARVYCPGVTFQVMPIFEGEQGEGKSTMLRLLGGPFFLEGLPHDLGREAVMAAEGKWIIEVEELAAFRKIEAEALKAFITRQVDKIRKPYAKTAQNYPRRSVLAGTTNENAYLIDSTGNRRFLPTRLGRIYLGQLAMDRDALLAEARDTWLANPDPSTLEMPATLYSVAAAEQEERRIEDPWERAVGQFLDKHSESTVATETILYDALRKTMGQATSQDTRRIAKAMKRNGWVKARVQNPDGQGGRVHGYKAP